MGELLKLRLMELEEMVAELGPVVSVDNRVVDFLERSGK